MTMSVGRTTLSFAQQYDLSNAEIKPIDPNNVRLWKITNQREDGGTATLIIDTEKLSFSDFKSFLRLIDQHNFEILRSADEKLKECSLNVKKCSDKVQEGIDALDHRFGTPSTTESIPTIEEVHTIPSPQSDALSHTRTPSISTSIHTINEVRTIYTAPLTQGNRYSTPGYEFNRTNQYQSEHKSSLVKLVGYAVATVKHVFF